MDTPPKTDQRKFEKKKGKLILDLCFLHQKDLIEKNWCKKKQKNGVKRAKFLV